MTWATTRAAAEALGVSAQTLKRSWAHPEQGFLREGVHWVRGRHGNSSRGWDIEKCRSAMQAQGHLLYAQEVW